MAVPLPVSIALSTTIYQNSMQRAYQALGIPYNTKNPTRPLGMRESDLHYLLYAQPTSFHEKASSARCQGLNLFPCLALCAANQSLLSVVAWKAKTSWVPCIGKVNMMHVLLASLIQLLTHALDLRRDKLCACPVAHPRGLI